MSDSTKRSSPSNRIHTGRPGPQVSDPAAGLTGSVPHAEMRRLVADCFDPDPRVYWLDFLANTLVGWAAFWLAVRLPGAPTLLFYLLAAATLYRAVIFTHELVHVRRDSLPGFRLAWNAACGVPLLAPAFLYDGVHQEHHFRHHYGTPEDGEYLPFGHPPRWMIPLYLLSHVLIPALAILRFGLIGPLSWAWPALRRRVLRRMSSLSIDPRYVRPLPASIPPDWRLQEAACAALVWGAGTALWLGWLPARVWWLWYAVVALILVLNGIRTLAAHRYANRGGTLSRDEQLLDSVNIAGRSPLTPLLAPVGLRYHALHHLFPTMPYHRLGAAHRRLMRALPADAAYRATVEPGFLAALADLWQRAGGGGARTLARPSG